MHMEKRGRFSTPNFQKPSATPMKNDTNIENISKTSCLNTNVYVNLIVIIFLSILTFIPIKFVHPLRVKKLRNITIFCTIIWSATTLKLITTLPNINLFNDEKIVLIIWIACSFYFATISVTRSLKGFINYQLNLYCLFVVKYLNNAVLHFAITPDLH